jgi:HPt (histidine-containing phosphotransfer) domain-containing protein
MQLDAALNSWIRNKQNSDTLRLAETGPARAPQQDSLPKRWRIKGIDFERGQTYYSGGNNYLKVLKSFCTHTPVTLERLKNLTSVSGQEHSGFLAEYAITIHGLKGSCYGICADRLGFTAQVLENAAKAGDMDTLQKENPAFISLVEQMLAELQKLLNEQGPEKNSVKRASEPDRILLDMLLNACRYYRISEMEEIMVKLEAKEYDSGEELIQTLHGQMKNLDYEAMTELLEKQNNILLEEEK